ncbi:MAG: GH3 auxin-responsive promoter family protein [Alphaproteobacteria bacterium]|nr:GH3 auxin-responsive promoter family protein [Alphaproteobacteria bacterium]
MNFSRHQDKTLKDLLKNGSKSLLFERLGISHLYLEGDDDILWQIFSSEVPIFEPRIFVDYCAQLSDWTPDYESVFSMRNSISGDRVQYLAKFEDGVVPLSRAHFKSIQRAFLKNIQHIQKRYGLKGKVFHVFDHEAVSHRYGLKVSTLSSLLHQSLSSGFSKRIEPPFSSIEEVGKSHYQKLHAFLDCLNLVKDSVELLLVSPRTLSDMAMLLSQRLGRAVTIKDLCPNVKVICYCYDESLPYRKVLAEFFEGQDVIRTSMFTHETGMLEGEDSLTHGGEIALSDSIGYHYGFIEESTLKNAKSPARRSEILRYEDLEEGQSYLILLNSMSGLVQYNSQQIFALKDKGKALFEFKRSAENLDQKVPFLTENTTNLALYRLNQALESYGFYVREYMVGFNVHSRQVEWCLELNRSLDGIQKDTLEHISYLLHTELAFLSEDYKVYYKDHFAQQPLMTFIPLGTFSSLPERYAFNHLDSTEKNVMIKSLFDLAWQKQVIHCKAL